MPKKAKNSSFAGVNSAVAVDEESAKDTSTKQSSKSDAAFIREATQRFKDISTDPNEVRIRTEGLEDLKFKLGGENQWPDAIVKWRKAKGRPIITVNKIRPACRIVTNEQRQNRPSIKVNPVDDLADIKTAEIFQGMIRHIETQSMDDVAWDNACDGQTTSGFGYIELVTDYTSSKTFQQEIYIRKVPDAFKVYPGPMDSEGWYDEVFKVEDLTPSQYRAKYPKSTLAGLNDFSSIGDSLPGWGTATKIRVAERYWRTFEDSILHLMSDGSEVLDEDLDDFMQGGAANYTEIKQRDTQIPKVYWKVFNAKEVLESREWAGDYVPIIPVLGEEVIADGERHLIGVVRDAKDPQRQYNYWRSLTAETMALSTKSPIIMAEGQDEGHENEWKTANIENYSRLVYKPKTVGGVLVPAPQRNTAEPPVQAMLSVGAHFDADIKATTMVQDANLGIKSNETSGAAITNRKEQGQVGNYNFISNLGVAKRKCGIQLINLIPRIYDARAITRIIGENNKSLNVNVINDKTSPAFQNVPTDTGGLKSVYNIGVGTYDVVVSTGPSYLTRRQEAFDMLTKLVNSRPELMEEAGDKIMEHSDIPGAVEIAARLKAMMYNKYPFLRDLEEQDPNAMDISPKARMMIKTLTDQQKLLVEQLNKATDLINNKQLELDAKERMNTDNNTAKVEVANIGAKVEKSMAEIQQYLVGIESTLKLSMQQRDHLHDATMGAMQQDHEQNLQDTAPQPATAGA